VLRRRSRPDALAHATLVHASLVLYCRFVQRLSSDEREVYDREMALVAEIFGMPRE